jgi:hypothetical protein
VNLTDGGQNAYVQLPRNDGKADGFIKVLRF